MILKSAFVRRSILVGALSLFVVGCRSGTGSEPPTIEELSDALLIITDMDGDWNETQRQTFVTRSNENPSIDPSIWCPDAEQIAKPLTTLAGDSGADVEMQYTGLVTGARLLRQQAWHDDNATDYLETVKAVIDTCDAKTWTDEDGVTYTFTKIPDPGVGDEAAGFSTEMNPPESTQGEKYGSVGRAMIVRVGDTVMVLQAGDMARTDSSVLLDDEEWTEMLETAVDKIKKL